MEPLREAHERRRTLAQPVRVGRAEQVPYQARGGLSGTGDARLGIGAKGSANSARGAVVSATIAGNSEIATLWQQEAQRPHWCVASDTSDP
jgi:hypothetical protein